MTAIAPAPTRPIGSLTVSALGLGVMPLSMGRTPADVVLATKGGITRGEGETWGRDGSPGSASTRSTCTTGTGPTAACATPTPSRPSQRCSRRG
ncbi:hypothetical protein [Brachybacterium squillarum]|uniref:hypothetical protein n=1 Tax=Brachybacterium squillarum TaxID=661979 RepID=UPI001FE00C0B|nr:hypothetical protein [Brachybacterium squillarum]